MANVINVNFKLDVDLKASLDFGSTWFDTK